MPRDDVKYSATATGTIVAKPVGDGEARLPGIAKNSATTAVLVVAPTVARSVGDGETRPHGIAKQSAMTDSDVSVSSDKVGLSWSKANGMNSAAGSAAVKSAGEARPHGVAKQSATTKTGEA